MVVNPDCLVDRAIERIRAYLASPGVSRLGFAKRAGLGESVVRDIQANGANPTANTLRALERAIPADFEPSQRKG